jgi:23S rRNA (guanosine2251-2'-O)-methyltransferase
LILKKEEFIYGLHPVIEAIKFGKEIDKVLFRAGLKGETVRVLAALVKENNVPFQYVPVEKLNRLTTKNHQGVIAFLSMISYTKLEDLVPFIFESGKSPLLLVLDSITDVRNLGAVARTAECAGADGIIIPAYGSAQVSEDAIRSSAGALLRVPVCKVSNLATAVSYIKQSGIRVAGATEKAREIYTDAELHGPLAIVMGSEEKGLSPDVIKLCDDLVSIPMMGEISSLNVSVASGVLLFEAVRQRRKQG